MSEEKQIYFIVEEMIVEEDAINNEGKRSGTDTGGDWGYLLSRPLSRRDVQAHRHQRKRVGIKSSVLKAQMQEMIETVNELFA